MLKKIVIFTVCFLFLAAPSIVWAGDFYVAVQDGDLVKAPSSGAVYLIQGGQRHVFGHLSIYQSWGYPDDFSAVLTISATELADYPEGEPVAFREGTLFRGTTNSLYGKTVSCVFVVENGKIRPIKSAEIYQTLYQDPNWQYVRWVPDDYLTKFSYPLGEDVASADLHPDGTLVKDTDANDIYLIQDGKLQRVAVWQALVDGGYFNAKTNKFTVPYVVTDKVKSYLGPPTPTGSITTFQKTSDPICLDNGKPIIRMFSFSGCSHCQWIFPAFNAVAKEYGSRIMAHDWDLAIKDDLLTLERETVVPTVETALFNKFSPGGGVPVLVFGCQYFRIGAAYEASGGLEAEKNEFRLVINALLAGN